MRTIGSGPSGLLFGEEILVLTVEARNFAKSLREECKATGIPLKRFLPMIDVSYRTFKQWENGIHSPSIDRVAKVNALLIDLKEQ